MYSIDIKESKVLYRDETEGIQLSIPRNQLIGMVVPEKIPGITEETIYKDAILSPKHGEGIFYIARRKKAKSASIIVSDVTRNVPTKKVAGYIVSELLRAGVEEEKIFFIIALGVHRPATEQEIAEILGEEVLQAYPKLRALNHEPYNGDKLMYLGETSYNTKIEVNKEAYECDIHINIGKVEPHEFAGFSGGRKSVMPGISSAESIIANHSPSMLASPYAVPGNLKNNPIHMDMLECARRYGIDFSVNFVVNDSSEPVALLSGDLERSHQAAVDYLYERAAVAISKPDIIVTTPGYPLNIELYQAIKPLIALTDIISEEMVVVLYAACPEGVNSPDMIQAFKHSHDLEEVNKYAIENYRIQMDHVLLLSKILKKKVKIIVYSPNINPSDIEAMHMIPCKSIEELMPLACSLSRKDKPQILIYPQAQKYLTTLVTGT